MLQYHDPASRSATRSRRRAVPRGHWLLGIVACAQRMSCEAFSALQRTVFPRTARLDGALSPPESTSIRLGSVAHVADDDPTVNFRNFADHPVVAIPYSIVILSADYLAAVDWERILRQSGDRLQDTDPILSIEVAQVLVG